LLAQPQISNFVNRFERKIFKLAEVAGQGQPDATTVLGAG
jgi:hypothetical protein